MSIRKKKNRWQADITHNNERIRPYFVTRGDAIKWEETTRYELRTGLVTVAEVKRKLGHTDKQSHLTLVAVAEECWEHHWKGTKDEITRYSHVKDIEAFFGSNFKIEDFKNQSRIDFVKWLKVVKQNKASTVNKKLSAVRVVLDFAVDQEYIPERANIKSVKSASNFRNTYITEEQEAKIIKFTTNHPLESVQKFGEFWQWSIDTGLRFEESRGVTRKDIYDDETIGWVVMVQEENSKTDTSRTVPLTTRALQMANKQQGINPWDAFDKHRIARAWKYIRRHMDMVDNKMFVPYLTRHTLGSRLVQRTGNIKMVKEFMGHSNIAMTDKYAKISPKNLIEARDALQQHA